MILGIYPEAAYQFSHVWSGLSRHKKGETKITVDHWGHGTFQASVTVTGRNWNYYDWVQGPDLGPALVNRAERDWTPLVGKCWNGPSFGH